MEQFQDAFSNIIAALPSILWGIILIIIAWIVAALVRRGSRKGMEAANLDERFQQWGVANDQEQAETTIQSISQVFYYLVWVLFLPGIFQRFGLTSIAQPITNMIDTALNYIPNIIGAAILVVIGVIVGRFLYNLVYNFSVSLNLDGLIGNLSSIGKRSANKEGEKTAVDPDEDQNGPVSSRSSKAANRKAEERKDSIAKVLGTIVYILIFIPILTVALETLQIESISVPIINVLNSIMNAIPNILLAVILLGAGIFIAKIVGDLTEDLLAGAGVDNLSKYLGSNASKVNVDLSKVIGTFVTTLIALFIAVEALNVLNLEVLNTIGAALIAYLPNVIFAVIILGLGVIGGQLLGNFISESLGSRWLGGIVQGALTVLSLFMAFDQLNFATSIVNLAFIFIIGGISVAFALAFGVGGRDFASKQLEKLDTKLDSESEEIKRNLDEIDQNNQTYGDYDSRSNDYDSHSNDYY